MKNTDNTRGCDNQERRETMVMNHRLYGEKRWRD